MASVDSFFKDLGDWFRELYYERTISPLLPSFCISWLVWNYRLIAVLLSDTEILEKLAIIDSEIFYAWPVVLLRGIVGPLATALLYIYLYPYPARVVYEHALKKQRDLSAIRERIEAETPLTVEASAKLRNYYYEREKELIRLIAERDEAMQQLRMRISILEKPTTAPIEKPAEIPLSKPTEEAQSGGKKGQDLSHLQVSLLEAIASAERTGRVATELWLQSTIPGDTIEKRYLLEDLANRDYVKRDYASKHQDYFYELRQEGRRILITLGLAGRGSK